MTSENEPEHYDEPTGFETEEIPSENVEEVVAALDDAFLQSRDGHHLDTKSLHDRVCHTELKNLFEHYEQHHILTIKDIENSINIVLTHLDGQTQDLQDNDLAFLQEKRALLQDRAAEIDRGTRRYVQTVSKFFHISKQQNRMSVEDFKMEFERIDRLRRTAHDGLISTLTLYTKTVNELYEYGLLDGLEIEQWHYRDRFDSAEEVEGKVFVFSPEVLKNRELVKNWAVSAHLTNRLQEIDHMQNGLSSK